MGTLIGHVAPGFAFLALGLWHLFNHIKLHCLNPNSYKSSPWFPTTKIRYIELFLIMITSSISISMELFIGPERHQPFEPDGTIPSNHLHNFEHATISLTFFTYATLSILLDHKLTSENTKYSLTQFIAAIAFAQQFLLFHLHSADHMGVEGQYHLLLQIVILVSLITTLLGISMCQSFLVSFVRSTSILFQGAWLILMGYMLWTPEFIPKGCFIHLEEGHEVVRCDSHEALHRAKSLVNLQFSWFLIGITIFSVSFYLVCDKIFGDKEVGYYATLTREEEEDDGDFEDVESQKKNKHKLGDHSKSFIEMGKSFASIDMER